MGANQLLNAGSLQTCSQGMSLLPHSPSLCMFTELADFIVQVIGINNCLIVRCSFWFWFSFSYKAIQVMLFGEVGANNVKNAEPS